MTLAIRQTRKSPYDSVLDPSEHFLNLAGSDVGIEQPHRHLAIERPVRPAKPGRRLLLVPQHHHRLPGNASDSIQPVGLVRGQPASLTPTGERAWRHVKHAGRFRDGE